MRTVEQQQEPTAQDAYERNYATVCELLLPISKKVYADYHNPDKPKDWDDVGDLGHAINVLQDVTKFVQA